MPILAAHDGRRDRRPIVADVILTIDNRAREASRSTSGGHTRLARCRTSPVVALLLVAERWNSTSALQLEARDGRAAADLR
jgi:hypothetical protein